MVDLMCCNYFIVTLRDHARVNDIKLFTTTADAFASHLNIVRRGVHIEENLVPECYHNLEGVKERHIRVKKALEIAKFLKMEDCNDDLDKITRLCVSQDD